jgi:hypothetical protein
MNRRIRDEFLGFFGVFFVDKRFIFFFEKDSRLGPASPSFLIPLFAKNSRLGYFFYAKNQR